MSKIRIVKYSPILGNNVGDIIISKCIEYCFKKNDVEVESQDLLFRKPLSFKSYGAIGGFKISVSPLMQKYIPRIYYMIKLFLFYKHKNNQIISKSSECYDAVILGGGNIIMNNMGCDYSFRVIQILKKFRLSGKKTIIFGAGVGPFVFAEKSNLEKINKYSDVVFVRDRNSANYWKENNLNTPRVIFDPAFVVSDICPSTTDKKIWIGVNLIGLMSKSKDAPKWIHGLIDLAKRTKLGIKIIVTAYPSDLFLSRELYNEIRDNGVDVKLECLDYSVGSVMRCFSDLKIFVGCRMHSLIFALSYGVPSIGYSWDDKVNAMFEMVFPGGGERFVVDDFFSMTTLILLESCLYEYPKINIETIKENIYKNCAEISNYLTGSN